ncbi:MAG: DUF3285 domain-containing protein [Prochlorothrix sp.]|nr:DUF3285 domain-containing protein [Prochlorothrix sp.]
MSSPDSSPSSLVEPSAPIAAGSSPESLPDASPLDASPAAAASTSVAAGQPEALASETASATEPPPSYVKLAMRNMVKKGRKSLTHFFLTTLGLLGVMVGLAYLTR